MSERPTLGMLDYAAGVSVIALLVLGYVIFPNTVFQYGIWLTIFTIWMAWFVYYGTKWMYGLEG
jgi:hypothetical protein